LVKDFPVTDESTIRTKASSTEAMLRTNPRMGRSILRLQQFLLGIPILDKIKKRTRQDTMDNIKVLLDQIDAVKAENSKLEAEIAGENGSSNDKIVLGCIGIGTINSACIRGLLGSEGREKVGMYSYK
jgi:hypothetical protein